MAIDTSNIANLLNAISDSLKSSQTAFPEDASALLPPQDGISLLDVKNDLLLSYLQHLVFLILIRLEGVSKPQLDREKLDKKVIGKLIELRAYLDRGCRSLEGKLRYQIDKVLRAAEDTERSAAQNAQINGGSNKQTRKKTKSSKRKPTTNNDSDISISGSEATSDSNNDSEDQAENFSDDDEDLHTAPRLSHLIQKPKTSTADKSSSTRSKTDTIYRPPKITPTAMPSLQPRHTNANQQDAHSARRRKHALLDEYLNEETSTTPTALPSIGSNNTITQHGRTHTSMASNSLTKERERQAYEEANFTRLPAMSKAEKRREKTRGLRDQRDMFGGEDWTGLGGLGDRIGRSVSGAGGKGGRSSVLERREKRKRETGDLPRGDGVGVGETFEKRRRVLQGRERKKGRR